jgi:hypothetical protein
VLWDPLTREYVYVLLSGCALNRAPSRWFRATLATAPSSADGIAPNPPTTELRHEVLEPSGAGQSSRRERSRREASKSNRRLRLDFDPWPVTSRLAACVGRDRKEAFFRNSHPRPELRWRATAVVVRGVLDRSRSCSQSDLVADVDERRAAWWVRAGVTLSKPRRSSSNMREHHRANRRRKPNHGGKTEGSVAGPRWRLRKRPPLRDIRRRKAL